MIDRLKIIGYINKEITTIANLISIKENKETVNVKFISQTGLDYSITLNKHKFEGRKERKQ